MKRELHLKIDSNDQKAVDVLSENTDFSRQRIKQIMQQGAVWLTRNRATQRIRRASKRLVQGDELHIYYNEEVLSQTVAPAVLIADEGDYSILFKPCGMLSQGSKWGDNTTIYRWAEQNLQPQRPAFLVHRLDRAASGLIMLAHKKKTSTSLARLFENRCITKKYRATVAGKFPDQLTMNNTIDGRQAHSVATRIDFKEASQHAGFSLVEIAISTGRKHQIRRHLSAAGFPIIGDRLYGDPLNLPSQSAKDLQLRACYLAFTSPHDQQFKTYSLPDALQLRL